ncbi:histone deacetylase [soil metagenome]
MSSLSRRELLGLFGTVAAGAAGFSLLGCQSKTKLVTPTSATGLAVASGSDVHTLDGHPESAARTREILNILRTSESSGLVAGLHRLPSRSATLAELERVHSKEYVARIQAATKPGTFITSSRWSPYAGPHAFTAACAAAGSALELATAIDDGRVRNGFAVVRPPGHHAGRDSAAGYCIFNNVAIAAKSLQAEKHRRIAIVDFDVHHGNGIQDTFYQDGDVLYISTHQDDWPFTGKIEMIGEGRGLGTNINIALPLHTGDDGIKKAYDQIVVPALRRFKPDLILVAAGFDGHWRDPQGSFELSLGGLADICSTLNHAALELCGGKIGYILEGGYQLEVLGSGVSNALSLLSFGENSTARRTRLDPFGPSAAKTADVDGVLRIVRKIHRL